MYRKAIFVVLVGAALAFSCEPDEDSGPPIDAGPDSGADGGTDSGTPDASTGLDCPPATPVEGPGTEPPNGPCDEDADCLANSCRDPAMNPDEGCTCRNLDNGGECPIVDVTPGSVPFDGACDEQADCADGLPCLDCVCI